MKLHLPKLLLVAVVAASSFAQAADYNVGNLSGQKDKLPSSSSNYHVLANNVENGFELSGSDRLGYIANGSLITSFGKEEWTSNYKIIKTEWTNVASGTVTPNVKVNGTFAVKGNAQVVLGGQYKQNNKALGVDTGSSAEFTGIIADTLLVQENASVTSYNALVDNLTVEGGTVNIHTSAGEGNLGMRLEGAKDSKQVQIKKELNVSGGNVTIGHAGYINSTYDKKPETHNPQTEYHTVVSFGSFSYTGSPTIVDNYIMGVDSYNINSSKITQSDGNLKVAGKSLSIGGLNIEQTGGTMEISKNTYHFLSDYGDSEIKQSGGTMTLGCLKAYNSYYDSVVTSLNENGQTAEINPSVAITQDGAGVMNLNGVIFTNQKTGAVSGEQSTIAQSGGGKINLGGEYKGVTFDITQEDKGGVLNINGDLKTDVVKQNGAGSIVVASSKTLSANTVYAGTVVETHDSEGNVTSRSGSVEISGNVNLTDGELKTETSENGAVTVTNEGSLKADKITVSGDTFVNKGVIVALSSQADAALMMLSGSDDASGIVVVEGGKYVEYGTCEKSILVQEGGTLTLLDGSNVADVTLESGTINVTGTATVGSLTLNDANSINFNFNGEVAPSIVLTSEDALDLSSTTIKVTVSTEMLETLAGRDFELFGGNVENITNATYIFTDGDADTSNDKIADVVLGSTSGSIKVENVQSIPEPATATLSLLALAGLCARRRRR